MGMRHESVALYPCPARAVTVFHVERNSHCGGNPEPLAVKGSMIARSGGRSCRRWRSADARIEGDVVLKAARSSYRNEGKKERQVAQFPALKEEIAKRRKALH